MKVILALCDKALAHDTFSIPKTGTASWKSLFERVLLVFKIKTGDLV
jgi:hypothetical protein